MAKIVDITEKLDFDSRPQIKLGNTTVTVNNEAVNVIKIMPFMDKNMTPENIFEVCSMLFSEDDFEKIKALNLSVKDFMTVVETSFRLITGGNEPGEKETRATT